jgi:Secretion system C-terminal sorting domain
MKIIFILSIVSTIVLHSKAQQTFQKVIYNDSSKTFSISAINPTQDGGFIFSGSNDRKLSNGTVIKEVKLGKFNRSGDLQWMRIVANGWSEPVALQLEDSSYIISNTGAGINLIKTDKSGNTLWRKIYNHPENADNTASIVRAANGFVYILYFNPAGVGILKIDAQNGVVLTDNLYSVQLLEDNIYGTSLYQTSDKGFIICGANYTDSPEGPDIYLIKVDSSLNKQWAKIIYKHSGSPYNVSIGNSVIESLDKGYVIAGYNRSKYSFNIQKADLIKVDNAGNAVWHKQFSSDSVNYFGDITKNADSTFTVIGRSGSCGHPCSFRATITKINSKGTIVWSRLATKTNDFYSIIKSNSKSFTVSGSTGSFGIGKGAFHIMRFTNDGESCADIKINKFSVSDFSDSIVNNNITVTKLNKSRVIITDLTNSGNTTISLIIQSSCIPAIVKNVSSGDMIAKNTNVFNAAILPNPVSGNNIQLKITSPLSQKMLLMIVSTEGKIIMQSAITIGAGNNNKTIDISNLINGVYFLKLPGTKDQKVIQFIKAG